MELENSQKDNILRTDSIKEKADQNGMYPKTLKTHQTHHKLHEIPHFLLLIIVISL